MDGSTVRNQLMPEKGLTDRKLVVAIVVSALIVITAGSAGSIGWFLGGQQSIATSKADYAGFLQEALGKIADVSHSKSLKVASAGFDALGSAFQFANATRSVPEQYWRLCINLTSQQSFSRTATLTGDSNITSTYATSCNNYSMFANDFGKNTNLSSDFTKLVFSLM